MTSTITTIYNKFIAPSGDVPIQYQNRIVLVLDWIVDPLLLCGLSKEFMSKFAHAATFIQISLIFSLRAKMEESSPDTPNILKVQITFT